MVPGRIPPREVVRIFVSIVLRGVLATAVGLVVAKLVFVTGVEPDRETAINVGYVVVAGVFLLTFFFKGLPGPELEYPESQNGTGQSGESLIGFLYEKDGAEAAPDAASGVSEQASKP